MNGEALTVRELARRVVAATAEREGRFLLGIAGPPGAGKSTLAEALCAAVDVVAGPGSAAIAPMDGFHLSNAVLRARGDLDRKGEPDTFDVDGYLAHLRALRGTATVRWPTFDRRLDEPTPGGVVITTQRVVITEGNYLLLDGAWARVRTLLDGCWYLDADRELLRRRLVARHESGGRDPARARRKVDGSDLRNADLVASTRARADLVLRSHGADYSTA